jgi:hypothetical protein
MGIPRQVEEAAQLAEELHARTFGPDAGETPAEESEAEAANSDTPVQPEPEKTKEQEAEELSFRERYLTLKGKYEAEVPRLSSELKELKQSIIDRLGDLSKKEPEPVKEAPIDPDFVKFKEEYGEEYVSMLEKMTESKARKIVEEALKSKIEPVQQKVASVEDAQIKAAQQNFKAHLTSKVQGDWESIWNGADPGFVKFLEQPDPSGLYTYGDLVEAYNNNWDADRLATVFNMYLQQSGKAAQPVASQPQTTNPVKEAAKDAMVAPRRSTQNIAPVAAEKTVWTQDSIRAFQKADQQGKYDAETSKAMWDDLLSALKENRIR